jgi:D-aminoacyl-tRNA deacylase
MLGVVVSRADSASEAIGEQLLELADWREDHDGERPDAEGGGTVHRTDGVELRSFDELHLFLDGVDDAFSAGVELIAVASRHSGETGPLLTAHHTGNFGPADYGGEPGSLARAAPGALARVRAAFENHAPERYDVGLECTHHGPTAVETPSLFVELGSGEAEWSDPEGARAVARAILALRGIDPDADRTLVGFGGGHYVPRFERVVRETGWTVGHVAADWGLAAMGDPREHRELVRAAFERSGARHALLDPREDGYDALRSVVDSLGYRLVSETWVRETDGVDLALVERLETELGPIDDGLRLGGRADAAPDRVETTELPEGLLDAANGVDRELTLSAVRERAVAVTTAEGASLLAAEAAVLPGGRAELVDALCEVLRGAYDSVERVEGAVVLEERAFSPERARELGVEEGPAFGRLADGQPVEVDGRTVDPEQVHERRRRRLPVE